MLLLPGDPEYEKTLGRTLPPDWRAKAEQFCGDFGFVAHAETGLLEAVSFSQLDEYIHGGEYDVRLSEIETDDFVDAEALECGDLLEESRPP
jgi:hypothetical protein